MNILFLFIEIIVYFTSLVLLKKFLGKTGVYVWIAVASVLANIQVCKSIDLFGLSVSVGNVLFASTFLATDILVVCYSDKDAKTGAVVGLVSVLLFLLISQLTLAYTPNSLDFAHSSMQSLFGLSPRVCLASVSMFFVANLLDIYLFSKLKTKKLWIKNNVCTIICNCLENFMFYIIAFVGIMPFKELIILGITASLIEILVALCDTPFLYWAKNTKSKDNN